MKSYLPLFAIFLVIGAFVYFQSGSQSKENITHDNAPAPPISKENKITNTKVEEYRQEWVYDSSYDKMREVSTVTATIKSSNQLYFDAPYSGGSTGSIILRKKGKSFDVILGISSGMIHGKYDGIEVPVKFDNGKPVMFRGYEPTDNSYNFAFISPGTKFFSLLKRSKHVTIELPFYQEGRRLLEFEIDSLKF